MHEVDIAEDVAIGIGFRNLPLHAAPRLASNKRSLLQQSIRTLIVSLGYTETLTFALCSSEDNADFLNKSAQPPHTPSASFNPIEV